MDLTNLQDFSKKLIMNKIRIFFIGLLLSSLAVKAQELELANHFFNKKAYVKAISLFEKEENKTQEVYEKLADCYYYNSQMDQAVVWYATLMEKHEATTTSAYYYKYAQALKGVKQYEKAELWLEKSQNESLQRSSNTLNKIDTFINKNENKKSIYTVYSLESNTEETDFGGAFYNNKLIFSSTRAGGKDYDWNKKPYLDLFQADIDENGGLYNIEEFSSKINTRLHESNAVFTKDGKRMFFTRNNFINGKQIKDNNKVTHLKIYSADLIDGNWANIKELPFNGDDYSVIHPALSKDEKKLYFSSDMPGAIGSFDLFEVNIDGDNYGKPTNLGANINTEQLEQFPFYSNDTLYFSSNRTLGFGGLDVFKSYNSKEGFTKPENLQLGINSSLDDFGFVLDEKSSTGYISSNREGGKGGDDIYKFKKATKILQIEGFVKDRGLLELVDNATVTLYNEKDSIIETIKTTKDGRFNFNLKPNKIYKIIVDHSLYIPETYRFKTKNDLSKINKTILLDSYHAVDANIIFKNNVIQIDHEPIYFDMNSSYLRPDAIIILDDVVRVIKKYPNMQIHCASHTDSYAEDKYNIWLSKRRAKRTADYIISKGIDASRITNDGYGETMLVNGCTDNVKCTKAEHQLNRRTEFILR
jgi:outer membrane protein OmpA-like peptidoglycan-associated protein